MPPRLLRFPVLHDQQTRTGSLPARPLPFLTEHYAEAVSVLDRSAVDVERLHVPLCFGQAAHSAGQTNLTTNDAHRLVEVARHSTSFT